MTTILIKKKDTAGAPAAGDLTNAAGGTEIAVNTATKRVYTKDSGGTVVELGTNPSALTTNLLFSPDATYDIGASGASRPRDMFLSRNLTVGGTFTVAGGINFNGNVTVGDSSSDTLTINSTITSNLIFTDNTYDIGASGANRPRNLYLSNDLVVSNKITMSGSPLLVGSGATSVSSPAEIQLDSGTSSKYSDVDYLVGGVLKWRVGMNGGDRLNVYAASLGNIAWWDNSTGYFVQQQGLTVSKNTAGSRPFITIDNASTDGGVGTGQYFINSGTGAKYNWVLGTQVVTNDAIEFVPSTAAGGATYTSPVLTLYPAQQVTINGNSITNSARLTVHGGPADPSTAGTGFSYVAEGAYGGGYMLRDGNYTWGIYDSGGNFKIGNGTTTGALTGRFNLTTGGVGMFGAGPNTSYTPSYGLGTYKGAAQNNALLINVDNGYNAYVNFSSYSGAQSFGYNYGASEFQWASADGLGSSLNAKLRTSGTATGTLTLYNASFATLAGASSGMQLQEGGGTYNAQYVLLGNSYNYLGVTGPGAMLYNYGGDMNFATDVAGGSSMNWSVGGARKMRLTSSALEVYQNVSAQVTSGTPGVTLATPGRSSKYIIPYDYGDVAINTWYTVWTFSYAYTGQFFMLILGYENNGGDGQNASAVFVSAANSAFAAGNQPTRLTGATGLECQIVSSSGGQYVLQVRRTYDSASTGNNYKAMLFLLQGE